MADITMCSNGEGCPMAKSCLRATAKADSRAQSYAFFEWRNISGGSSWCRDHMSNATIETKTNPPFTEKVVDRTRREVQTPMREWEEWITHCEERIPYLNPNETGSLWAYNELTRLRYLLTEKEKQNG